MPEEKKAPPPLTDSEIREALRLQSATICALMVRLRHKGILHADDMMRIKELRDALMEAVPEQSKLLRTPPEGKPN
jgi:hypothetical protein